MTRHPAALLILLLALALLPAVPAAADDYADPDYLAYDLDAMARTQGRQVAQATDPVGYGLPFIGAGIDTFISDAGQAVNDLRAGRIYGGGGRWIPGGSAGDPRFYYDVSMTEIAFTARTGAKLLGHVWAPIDAPPGPRPGVVITSGSIQGYEAMYFWAARDLARNGYVVMSWDAQGQGRSEAVGHAPGSPVPTLDGVPFQQPSNFVEATVDAMAFFLSTPDDPYVPPTWTPEDAAASQAAADGVEQIDAFNPLWGLLDAQNIGLAGHSLGATGAGMVQQCSDEGEVWRDLALCEGRSWPIRAVVGWDGLPDDVVPVVPAMDQNADGYFFTVEPQPQAPDPAENLGPFDAWTSAGLDSYSLTIRAGTHLEWCDLPLLLPATEDGTQLATYYTTAWFDRYLAPESITRTAALADLLAAPSAGPDLPWSGTNLSASRLSAHRLTGDGELRHYQRGAIVTAAGRGGTVHRSRDVRADGGWAPVGDWAGALAETG